MSSGCCYSVPYFSLISPSYPLSSLLTSYLATPYPVQFNHILSYFPVSYRVIWYLIPSHLLYSTLIPSPLLSSYLIPSHLLSFTLIYSHLILPRGRAPSKNLSKPITLLWKCLLAKEQSSPFIGLLWGVLLCPSMKIDDGLWVRGFRKSDHKCWPATWNSFLTVAV